MDNLTPSVGAEANDAAGSTTTPASDAALMTSLSMAATAAVAGGSGAPAASLSNKLDQPGAPPAKKRKFAHTNETQRRCMLEWLEQPGNFQLLASRSGAAVVDGKKIKKTDGFRALMRHVNLHAGASWTMDVTKSRFESFLTSYRKVKRQAQQPAFAVTENDRARGITSVAQKLNALCAFFDRIDALHASVQPTEPLADQLTVQIDEQGRQQEAVPVQVAPVVDTAHDAPSGVDMAMDDVNEDDAVPLQDTTQPAPVTDSAQMDLTNAATPAVAEASSALASQPTATEGGTSDTPLSPSANVAMSEELTLRQLAMERERLDLLQEQLAVQKREIELKALALQQQEDDRRRAVRAELAAKLAQAGKSVAEIKELLALVV